MTSESPAPAVPDGTDVPDDSEHGAALDGNAAGGDFAGIFSVDVTTVTVRCGSCGSAQAFAQVHAYLGGPGTVIRCRQCESMVARIARTRRGTWLDVSGSSSWLFPPTPAADRPTRTGTRDTRMREGTGPGPTR